MVGRTCDDGIERSARQQHTSADEPAPRWGIMPTLTSTSAIVNLMTSRGPVPSPGTSLSFLMPQRANRSNRNGTSEILTGHTLWKSSWLQTGILNRMVNSLQQRSESWRQQLGRNVGRSLLNRGNPAVRWRWCRLHDQFGLRNVGRILLTRDRYRSPSGLPVDRLWLPERSRDDLLINRDAIADGPRSLRVKELPRVLPDLRSVRTKREPQSDEVRLEDTSA